MVSYGATLKVLGDLIIFLNCSINFYYLLCVRLLFHGFGPTSVKMPIATRAMRKKASVPKASASSKTEKTTTSRPKRTKKKEEKVEEDYSSEPPTPEPKPRKGKGGKKPVKSTVSSDSVKSVAVSQKPAGKKKAAKYVVETDSEPELNPVTAKIAQEARQWLKYLQAPENYSEIGKAENSAKVKLLHG